ncbi:hypothetical protein [Staphylococcus pettenkoferi]|uniref:hypothetical protein n=1 Tax=Staphylococcus pettenkoferi TaxID=170573 RepID=UPI0016424A85|nr:hypothetical protein [Staphylococcus pettenkoferi]
MGYLMGGGELDEEGEVEVEFEYGVVVCELELYEEGVSELEEVVEVEEKDVDGV